MYTGPAGQNLLGASRPNRMLFAEGAPCCGIGGLDVEPGDMAWSVGNGRLYVYYDDGDTAQWVESQPLGMTPIGLTTASDVPAGTTAAFVPETLNTGENNTVTIVAGALIRDLMVHPIEWVTCGGLNKLVSCTSGMWILMVPHSGLSQNLQAQFLVLVQWMN